MSLLSRVISLLSSIVESFCTLEHIVLYTRSVSMVRWMKGFKQGVVITIFVKIFFHLWCCCLLTNMICSTVLQEHTGPPRHIHRSSRCTT